MLKLGIVFKTLRVVLTVFLMKIHLLDLYKYVVRIKFVSEKFLFGQ